MNGRERQVERRKMKGERRRKRKRRRKKKIDGKDNVRYGVDNKKV